MVGIRSKYLNNIVEQDHRFIRRRTRRPKNRQPGSHLDGCRQSDSLIYGPAGVEFGGNIRASDQMCLPLHGVGEIPV
ncbi:hypothetical protein Q5Y75_17655 [Ruegeria sp. 2205SS24-7]|uniref:hypothetical protein n=1 Tax=Ruegeria discodermiae TaxID=3064389 RepID=UPI002741826D|nr:hypothetical protein [Ruegeria sp. 2205SS24-7]MDP5219047.1 hypothetical protein [Ruegeria sp. 2205SS24-7]